MLFSRSLIPDLPLLGLTDDEKATLTQLESVAMQYRRHLEISEAYYLGEQVIQNLRIAIPKELEFLRTIVGWPAMAVDPYVERLCIDGFRLPKATDADEHLREIWDANGGDAEQSLAYTDALSMGRAFWVVGSPDEPGDAPAVTVESPLNVAVLWDLDGITPRAVLHEYWQEGRRHGAFMVKGKTITVGQDDAGTWEIVDRDDHGFPFVPVVQMANRPRTHDRSGRSEISHALRSLTDAACRTLLGLEVARELYSVPQRAILGASEKDFQNSDGTPKSAFETYITRVLALERDEEGNLPELKQLQAYDPGVFTKLLDWYASAASGEVAATPQDMGLYTQGNPASAEAVTAGNARRDTRARKMQNQFGVPLSRVMQMAVRFETGGDLPAEFKSLKVDWMPVSMETPAITADAVAKQVSVGAVPPTSDVVLKRLGYSAVERARLAADRAEDGAQSLLAEIASNLQVKQTRSDNTAITEASPKGAAPVSVPSPANGNG